MAAVQIQGVKRVAVLGCAGRWSWVMKESAQRANDEQTRRTAVAAYLWPCVSAGAPAAHAGRNERPLPLHIHAGHVSGSAAAQRGRAQGPSCGSDRSKKPAISSSSDWARARSRTCRGARPRRADRARPGRRHHHQEGSGSPAACLALRCCLDPTSSRRGAKASGRAAACLGRTT